MMSLEDSRRQIRTAAAALGFVVPLGVIGFMLIEQMGLLDALWLTVVTLTTIGYGDIVPRTVAGRLFAMLLIIVGLSLFAFALQAIFTFFVSPSLRNLRLQRRALRTIATLDLHFIICGYGELVEQTIAYMMQRARQRADFEINRRLKRVDRWLGWLPPLHRPVRRIGARLLHLLARYKTMLNVAVVVTTDHAYAEHLRQEGLLVVEGDPSDDETLLLAGVQHARALIVMLEEDSDTLLTTLTARSQNPNLFIVTAPQREELGEQMQRAGADRVVAPYDFAGLFLNNAALRPTVNDFFTGILFDHETGVQTTQLRIVPGSHWVNRHLGELPLREQFGAAVLGIRHTNGSYDYCPADDEVLDEQEHLIVVVPTERIGALLALSRSGVKTVLPPKHWEENLIDNAEDASTQHTMSLYQAEQSIRQLSNHYVICALDRIGHSAVSKLNPAKPFVIVSSDNDMTADLMKRGFLVVHGSPTDEDTLHKAGVERALAAMISLDDKADTILAVLNCRRLSKRLLITVTASEDAMVAKLKRAGADRVTSPFNVAGQFMMLAATRPAVSGFFEHVLFNTHARIETTELYTQDDSPWIGKTLEELDLRNQYNAGVLAIRLEDGSFVYAPPQDYRLNAHEVLIVITPMRYADELREACYETSVKRPRTLRRSSDSAPA